MTTTVQILISEINNAITVPEQAFHFSPKDRTNVTSELAPLKTGQRCLWKLEQGNQIIPVNVGIGVVGTERTESFPTSSNRVIKWWWKKYL